MFLPKDKSVADQEHYVHKKQQVLQLFLLEQTLCPFPAIEIKQSASAVKSVEGWEAALGETGTLMRNGTQLWIALSSRGGWGTAHIPPGRIAIAPEERNLFPPLAIPCATLLTFAWRAIPEPIFRSLQNHLPLDNEWWVLKSKPDCISADFALWQVANRQRETPNHGRPAAAVTRLRAWTNGEFLPLLPSLEKRHFPCLIQDSQQRAAKVHLITSSGKQSFVLN